MSVGVGEQANCVGSAQGRKPRGWRGRAGYWCDLIVRQCDSDLGIAEFCKQEGVHPTSFYTWRKKLGISAPQNAVRRTGNPKTKGTDQGVLSSENSFIKFEVR